jgi:ribonuclease HII
VALHIGTDEAGYGPLLGPLVVAASVYETDGDRSDLPGEGVDDSKVVYARGGRAALARVLGPYLGLGTPVSLRALLARLSVRGDPCADYPWYDDVIDPEPAPGSPPGAFRRLYVNPVCERDFNAGCAGAGGKAGLLFRETMRLVRRALEDAPEGDTVVVCDRHGGRRRYAALLMAELEPATLVTERESAAVSGYRLRRRGRDIRIRFVRQADASDKAAALASMAAKYVRELFMESLNAYFVSRVEDLRPTAGYYGDGRRFLRDVEGVLGELGCDRDTFVRVS